jgi:hypothetical protein
MSTFNCREQALSHSFHFYTLLGTLDCFILSFLYCSRRVGLFCINAMMRTLITISLVSSFAAALPHPQIPAVAAPAPPGGQVAFAGVNIAGFDFGCGIDGTCNTANTFDVVAKGSGIQQMQHFVTDDGLNAFRLPVAWQFLVNNQLGGPLDATNVAAYDKLVQGCVSSGAKLCMIDMFVLTLTCPPILFKR